MAKTIEVKLLPAQYAFMQSQERELVFSGGWGSGKSRSLCYKALMAALIPKNMVILARSTYQSLMKTTFKSLIEGDGTMPPVLPKGYYKYFMQKQRIDIMDGGSIFLIGLDVDTKFRSMNAGTVCVDECSEIELATWMELKGRLRNDAGSLRQICGATNPATKQHWIWKRFIRDGEAGKEGRKIITASSLENHHLPVDYINDLKEMASQDETSYRRYVLGEWVSYDDGVFKGVWGRDKCVMEKDPANVKQWILGVDSGFEHPAAAVLIGVMGDGALHVFNEWSMRRKPHSEIVRLLGVEFAKFKPAISYDPSAPALADEFSRQGMWDCVPEPADNSVEKGIDRLRTLMSTGRLTVSQNCNRLIDEIESYRYDTQGRVFKYGDDLCFSAGTMVTTSEGSMPIEDVKKGIVIFAGAGYNEVVDFACTGTRQAFLYELNGKFLVCTREHPVFVNGVKTGIGELCRSFNLTRKKELLKKYGSTVKDTEGTCILKGPTRSISLLQSTEGLRIRQYFIETYGSLNTGFPCLPVLMSIILISIIRTMIRVISFWSRLKVKVRIQASICASFIWSILVSQRSKWKRTRASVRLGMLLKRVWNGTRSTPCRSSERTGWMSLSNVPNVGVISDMTLLSQSRTPTSFVPMPASRHIGGLLERMMLWLYASYAELDSRRTSMQAGRGVKPAVISELLSVITETPLGDLPVYNITVASSHRYFANRILVSNCDALRYGIAWEMERSGCGSRAPLAICLDEEDRVSDEDRPMRRGDTLVGA